MTAKVALGFSLSQYEGYIRIELSEFTATTLELYELGRFICHVDSIQGWRRFNSLY